MAIDSDRSLIDSLINTVRSFGIRKQIKEGVVSDDDDMGSKRWLTIPRREVTSKDATGNEVKTQEWVMPAADDVENAFKSESQATLRFVKEIEEHDPENFRDIIAVLDGGGVLGPQVEQYETARMNGSFLSHLAESDPHGREIRADIQTTNRYHRMAFNAIKDRMIDRITDKVAFIDTQDADKKEFRATVSSSDDNLKIDYRNETTVGELEERGIVPKGTIPPELSGLKMIVEHQIFYPDDQSVGDPVYEIEFTFPLETHAQIARLQAPLLQTLAEKNTNSFRKSEFDPFYYKYIALTIRPEAQDVKRVAKLSESLLITANQMLSVADESDKRVFAFKHEMGKVPVRESFQIWVHQFLQSKKLSNFKMESFELAATKPQDLFAMLNAHVPDLAAGYETVDEVDKRTFDDFNIARVLSYITMMKEQGLLQVEGNVEIFLKKIVDSRTLTPLQKREIQGLLSKSETKG